MSIVQARLGREAPLAKDKESAYYAFGTLLDSIILLDKCRGTGITYEEYAREHRTLRVRKDTAQGNAERIRVYKPVSRSTFMRRMQAVDQFVPLEKRKEGKSVRYDLKHSGRVLSEVYNLDALDASEINAAEYQALRLAQQVLVASNLEPVSKQLRALEAKLSFLLPKELQGRLGPDSEVLAGANGSVARPGPREVIDPSVFGTISEAILTSRVLSFDYHRRIKPGSSHWRVEPAALLFGPLRHYLLGFPADQPAKLREQDLHPKSFALANISNLKITRSSFAKREKFSLQAHLDRAFGAYFGGEPMEVHLEFAAHRQKDVLAWHFHPSQKMEVTKTGSVIVKFTCVGEEEVVNHLFTWRNHVHVIGPKSLKKAYRARLAEAKEAIGKPV